MQLQSFYSDSIASVFQKGRGQAYTYDSLVSFLDSFVELAYEFCTQKITKTFVFENISNNLTTLVLQKPYWSNQLNSLKVEDPAKNQLRMQSEQFKMQIYVRIVAVQLEKYTNSLKQVVSQKYKFGKIYKKSVVKLLNLLRIWFSASDSDNEFELFFKQLLQSLHPSKHTLQFEFFIKDILDRLDFDKKSEDFIKLLKPKSNTPFNSQNITLQPIQLVTRKSPMTSLNNQRSAFKESSSESNENIKASMNTKETLEGTRSTANTSRKPGGERTLYFTYRPKYIYKSPKKL